MSHTFQGLVGDALLTIGEKITAEVRAVPTPFDSWNMLCGEEGGREGPAHSWMVVIGGADGSGKSYLGVNLAAWAVQNGHRVGFINFEMTMVGLTQRYLSILSGLPKFKLEHGRYFDMPTWLQAKRVADDLFNDRDSLLITNDHGVFDLDDIELAYERMAGEGCDVVVIDYAQLVQVKGQDGIFQRSEAVGNKLRELTHKYDVLTYVLSQFNREGKKLGEVPPTRHYLQGGSAWENNANQIVLIDHTLRIRDPQTHRIYTRLIMDKNRHGEMPVVWPVVWNTMNMQWEEGEPEDTGEIEIIPPDADPEDDGHPHDKHFGPQEEIPF